MTPPAVGSGRRSAKQAGILSDLRGRIISGEYAPGTRLPTRMQYQESFQLSSITVQSAIDCLIADGFVVPRGRLGTFVAERPPHLHRFGLIIPGKQEDLFFWRALVAAMQERMRSDAELRIYTSIDGRRGEEERLLAEDLRCQRLAGVVMTSSFLSDAEPLAHFPLLPQVAIMGPLRDHPRVAAVQLDWESFFATALDHFAARGRKRMAVIGAQGHEKEWYQSLMVKARARGIEMRAHWTHFLHPSPSSNSAQSLTHLLFHPDQRERPDCLLISDDHLVESASVGLVAAQLHVPGDVDVLGHGNFPLPSRAKVPITHLGYDAAEIIDVALSMLRDMRQLRGVRVADRLIPARLQPE
jgi:DNA-binding LacI/PurR family transcriptional regulator